MLIRPILSLAIPTIMSDSKRSRVVAVASLIGNTKAPSVRGAVYFREALNGEVLVNVTIRGLPAHSVHGLHIHEAGDLTEGCTSVCAHFNPLNQHHGGRTDVVRHVGDLGNISSDAQGKCHTWFVDHLIKLSGRERNIIGRSVVVHARHDDLGRGGHKESLLTGNSGDRIACGVIGYAREMFEGRGETQR